MTLVAAHCAGSGLAGLTAVTRRHDECSVWATLTIVNVCSVEPAVVRCHSPTSQHHAYWARTCRSLQSQRMTVLAHHRLANRVATSTTIQIENGSLSCVDGSLFASPIL